MQRIQEVEWMDAGDELGARYGGRGATFTAFLPPALHLPRGRGLL